MFILEQKYIYIYYANKSGLKFLHIDVRESLSVIANASFQFLLLKVAQVVVFSLGGNYFHTGSCGFGYLFSSLINEKI